jgi:hypothetical protein
VAVFLWMISSRRQRSEADASFGTAWTSGTAPKDDRVEGCEADRSSTRTWSG